MFRRRRRDEEPEKDLEPTDEETVAEEEPEGEQRAPAPTSHGPWDAEDDSIPEMDRADFGALQVPVGEGIEYQLSMEATEQDEHGNPISGRIVSVTVVHGQSGLQLQAFAAPKKSGIWDEIRGETADQIKQADGQAQEAEGPFGTELHAMVRVEIPAEMRDQVPPEIAEQGFGWQPVRFIGVDGPRWFLHGVLSGAALEDAQQARLMEEIFAQIVVVRGDAPMPPREQLELTVPTEAQQAMAAQAEAEGEDGRPPLNPFERGPEITEVR